MALLAQPTLDPIVDLADVLVATPYAPVRGLGGVAASIALAGTNSLYVIGNELAWYHANAFGANYTSLGTPTLVDGQFTVVVRFWIAGANQTTVFNSRNEDTATDALQIRISSAGALEILARGVASRITVSGAIRPGRWYTVVVRRGRAPDGSGGTADHKAWIDGALVGRYSGTGTGSHGEFAVAGGRISHAGDAQTNVHWVSFAAVIPRPTADHVCAALSADPWALLRPANDDAFVVDAGSGAYTLTADAGSYTLTGADATLRVGRRMTAAAGSYAYSGAAAGLYVGRRLQADAASYTITGADATLIHSGTPTAYTLTADAGAFTITGADATLKVGRVLSAAAGSYAYSGGAATFRRSYVLDADGASYTITGAPATLNYSGASSLLWTPQTVSAASWSAQSPGATVWTPQ